MKALPLVLVGSLAPQAIRNPIRSAFRKKGNLLGASQEATLCVCTWGSKGEVLQLRRPVRSRGACAHSFARLSWRRKGCFDCGSQFEDAVQLAKPVTSHPQSGRKGLVFALFSPFYLVQDLAHGVVLLTLRLGQSSPSKPLWRCPHRHVRKDVSCVILKSSPIDK